MHIGNNNFVPPALSSFTLSYRLGVRLGFKDKYLLGFGLVKDRGKS